MTRHLFGLSPADIALERVGDSLVIRGGAVGQVFDSLTGGTQLTDLTDLSSNPITTITADANGGVGFYGPSGVTTVYVDFGYTSRYLMQATDLGAQIAALASSTLPLSGGTISGNLAITGTLTADGATGWVNAKAHGALGDGTTDDTTALRAAISACPRGGVVFLPPGLYRTSGQLVLPPRTTLRGGYAPHWPQYARDTPQIAAGIKALTGFTDTSMVRLLDKSQGAWAETYMSSARITDLTIDGGNVGSNIAGIYATGQVVDISLSDVCVTNMTGHGIYTDTVAGLQPKGWQLHRVSVQSSGGSGFHHANTGSASFAVTDMSFENCWAGAGSSDGWHFESALSVDLLGCRSEFNAGYGYYAAGSSRLRWVDCDTDRSTKSGWRLECTGSGSRSILLVGCIANRDGANDDITPAGYAGFDIVGTSGTAHNPVTMVGCVVNVNHNDAGTGIYCPDYGLTVTYAPQVSVSGTLLNGTVAALLDSQKQVAYDSTTRFNLTNAASGGVTLEQANTHRIIGAAGTNRDIEFWTSTSGKRWALRNSSTAEGGSNAGSNFNIARYDDSGAVIDTPLSISRATGVVSAAAGLALTGGNALGQAQPRNHGIAAWSSDPTGNINATLLVNGTVYLTAIYPAATGSITKVYFHVTTVATTPTAAKNEVGIYSAAGTLLQTVNVDALITSTGLVTVTFTSLSLTAGALYWVGMVFNAATAPTVARAGNQTGANGVHNLGLTAATYRYATNGTAQNTLPSSITPASNTANTFAGPWVAVG